MKKIIARVSVDLSQYKAVDYAMEDIVHTLLCRGYDIDGIFIELRSETAYAWKEIKQ